MDLGNMELAIFTAMSTDKFSIGIDQINAM